jgi:hypothetical protein
VHGLDNSQDENPAIPITLALHLSCKARYLNPQRPPASYIRLLNRIGSVLERARITQPALCAERLMRHAQRRTGLRQWGDESALTGLRQLTRALNEQARLTQAGRIAAYFNLLDQLSVRLRLIDYRTRRAEVAAQPISKPLFILGLPRTGTTILYELIAQDPAFRAPATWEVARPFPPPTEHSHSGDTRIDTVERMLRLMEKLAPGFRAIHAIGARLPQECVYILASSFISEQFTYMYNIPDYRAWVLAQDMTAPYRWHAQFLQHLQVDFARERWVLKTPAHLVSLPYLLAQYPDASIVWTHRRPLDAIASFSSLTQTLRSGFSSGVDPFETGEQEFRYFAKAMQQGVASRRALDRGQFKDVSFNAICADPMNVVAAIYRHFGWELGDEAETRMRAYLKRRPRHLYGKHLYSATAFGLDSTLESGLYGEYLSRYGDYL